MGDAKKRKLTVQGFRSPVPTVFECEPAGSPLSISLDSTTVAINATSVVDLEKEVFKQSTTLPRTPMTKSKEDELEADSLTIKTVTTPTTFVQEKLGQDVLQGQEKDPFRRSSSSL